jgi:ABC-type amino acid transport substrate-binding protein
MGQLDCSAELRTFIPRLHKKKYRVAVQAVRGIDETVEESDATFSQYLTETAGRRFDQVIEFEMVPLDFQGIFDAVANEEIDFLFANSGVYSCVGVESGAQPLATAISRVEVRGITFDIDVAGGKEMRMIAEARPMLSTVCTCSLV